ncbi:MAG: hypothetical protein E7070_05330 [Bacteroidales bacterium]|nr:hypothetical protein [Bacteroidales bacterium]
MLLWQRLESTRQLLAGQCRRFCVRNILRVWFPRGALPKLRGQELTFDDLVWRVCRCASPDGEILGWNELPLPSLCPRPHRELLRALVQVTSGIGHNKVNLSALDEAYSKAFPNSTPLNVEKKRKGF